MFRTYAHTLGKNNYLSVNIHCAAYCLESDYVKLGHLESNKKLALLDK